MFNLFDCTPGIRTLGSKPRSATHEERNAYLRWLATRDGIDIPAHATFGDGGIRVGGELIVAMPGYGDTRRAMLEVLDDAGNVLRSTPIAVDARGGMTMTKAQVQEATGLKPVRQPKARASNAVAKIKPAEICPVEAPQSAPASSPTADAQIAEIAPERQPEPARDANAALVARLDALERQVATLSRLATPTTKPARSPAHERAVRRAWAERKAARLQRAIAEDHMRMREQAAAGWQSRVRHLQEQLASKHTNMEKWAAEARKGRTGRGRRLAAAQRARRMLAESRQAATSQRQRGDVLHAQLAALKAAMADPTQPERASDIQRLMTERNQARNACAALEQRCVTMQGALEQSAAAIEDLASRATRAEAALRARAA